ncbi:hypothetical protein [Pseudobutyrivibrio xylanivorans]|uniref:Uncharacterized protein n=1 Tax=Pseudobutyrivibrio xylanivorans TaxID=185007 RepID=A0A5P6VUH5_PSEXY|nr:hypothetical protein [Pseudobutyrivibrio xylanivorans]QFJ56303.1 hypothetical protein FXF36_15405 [Pseudobutyrivibrio xylanivorans]
METIVLKKIIVNGNRAEYETEYPQAVKQVLRFEKNFFIEMPEGYNLEEVPESVLTITYVGAMLGIAMVFDCDIKVNSIDKEYYEDIKELLEVYRGMYPRLACNVNIIANNIEQNGRADGDTASLFFTGGVDATSAMIEVEKTHPILVNIWGGDVPFDDVNYHEHFVNYLNKLKDNTDVADYCFIKSNCRILVNEPIIDKLYRKKIDRVDYHGYWSSIAHIVAMSAIMAPLVYFKGIKTHYIGSSYKADSGAFRGDGNSVDIISKIHYLGCKFEASDSDITRVEKAKKIVDYQKAKNSELLNLRVCWYRKGEKNCSNCEKCYRTIMEIASNGGNPNEFGFDVDDAKYDEIKKYLETTVVKKPFWEATKDNFKLYKNDNLWDKKLEWMCNIKINSLKAYYKTVIKKLFK